MKFGFLLLKIYLFDRVIYVQNAPEKQSLPSSTVIAQSHTYTSAPVQPAPHPSHALGDPADNYFKPYQDINNEETSIDLKGVRNLHIFFNDENRIRVQKDNVQSCTVDLENSDAGEGCSQQVNGQRLDTENHGTSWHIKIGKSKEPSDVISSNHRPLDDNYGGILCPPENGEISRRNNNDKLTAVKCNDIANGMNESPVLKLQIKKAEIVIKFGQKSSGPDSTTTDDKQNDERTNDTSLNIQIDSSEKDKCDPIVIDLVQNTYDQAKTVSEPSDTQNPVQIRLDFRNDSENKQGNSSEECPSTITKDLINEALLEEVNNWGESDNNPTSEPGSGSQSPLLASKVDMPN